MTSTGTATQPLQPDPASTPESQTQFITALATIAAVTVIAIGALVVFWHNKDDAAISIVSMISGGLLAALNVPTGLSKLLTASKQVPQTPQPQQDIHA